MTGPDREPGGQGQSAAAGEEGPGREREVVGALVSLAGRLATGESDAVELLSELVAASTGLLGVTATGLLLADDRAVLHVMAASSDEAAHVEAMQLQRQQGPCLDCYQDGRAVEVPDLEAERERWPLFVPAARAAGYASVHAVPLRLRHTVLGAMGLFGARPGALSASDALLAQGLADIASIALVQDRAAADRDVVRAQLQLALDSRVVLEQAKGMLAYSADLSTGEAFAVLRTFAREHDLRLTDLARAVVERRLPTRALRAWVDVQRQRG